MAAVVGMWRAAACGAKSCTARLCLEVLELKSLIHKSQKDQALPTAKPPPTTKRTTMRTTTRSGTQPQQYHNHDYRPGKGTAYRAYQFRSLFRVHLGSGSFLSLAALSLHFTGPSLPCNRRQGSLLYDIY